MTDIEVPLPGVWPPSPKNWGLPLVRGFVRHVPIEHVYRSAASSTNLRRPSGTVLHRARADDPLTAGGQATPDPLTPLPAYARMSRRYLPRCPCSNRSAHARG